MNGAVHTVCISRYVNTIINWLKIIVLHNKPFFRKKSLQPRILGYRFNTHLTEVILARNEGIQYIRTVMLN